MVSCLINALFNKSWPHVIEAHQGVDEFMITCTSYNDNLSSIEIKFRYAPRVHWVLTLSWVFHQLIQVIVPPKRTEIRSTLHKLHYDCDSVTINNRGSTTLLPSWRCKRRVGSTCHYIWSGTWQSIDIINSGCRQICRHPGRREIMLNYNGVEFCFP